MSRFIDGQKYPPQPTLPGRIDGVIEEWEEDYQGYPRRRTTLQCSDCGVVEQPVPLTVMTLKFQPQHKDGKRRCRDCRVVRHEAEYPNCRCDGCLIDTTGRHYQ